ncbi:unnamed protein product [Phaedon cochleariae]|uniref:Double jelly roll-like domain-containing protein n=1 Tax=Phaedon cochleariae TaxID=80249 RepID=A0A9N9X1Q8_PHACE|nr:unnamed protein product [Phaedon cochleariae]
MTTEIGIELRERTRILVILVSASLPFAGGGSTKQDTGLSAIIKDSNVTKESWSTSVESGKSRIKSRITSQRYDSCTIQGGCSTGTLGIEQRPYPDIFVSPNEEPYTGSFDTKVYSSSSRQFHSQDLPYTPIQLELPNGPTTTTTTVEVQIHSVVLKVKHVFPNDEIKLQLMQPIKNDTPILIPFRKWDLSQLPALTNGAKSEIWAVKTSASVERPRYVIVCFQKAKRDNAEADATHFDNTSIVSIRLALNGEYWPNERMQLDFAKQDYTLAYYNYTRFYSSYSHSMEVHPILDYGEFKQHALFVIDCSRQEETMKSSTVDIKLEIEADKGFPADTKAYCIIVHDCLLEYFPLTEVVRTLI